MLARKRITADVHREVPRRPARLPKGAHYLAGGRVCQQCGAHDHRCPECGVRGKHLEPEHCGYPFEMRCPSCGGPARIFGPQVEWISPFIVYDDDEEDEDGGGTGDGEVA